MPSNLNKSSLSKATWSYERATLLGEGSLGVVQACICPGISKLPVFRGHKIASSSRSSAKKVRYRSGSENILTLSISVCLYIANLTANDIERIAVELNSGKS
jgi:hypothetical protein